MKVRNDADNDSVEHADSASDGARAPEVDFTTLVLSFHQVALHALGVLGQNEDAPRNLPAARMQIDMLALLREKTDGNLDDDEKKLLDGALYELRMAYLEACRCD